MTKNLVRGHLRMVKVLFALSLICFASYSAAAPQSGGDTACRMPQRSELDIPVDLRPRDPTETTLLCVDSEAEATSRVILIYAYDGPADGLIFVVSRRAEIAKPFRTGKPVSSSIRRLASGKTILELEVKKGSGTGLREDEYELYEIERNQAKRVWAGLSYRREAPGIGVNPRIHIERGAISVVEHDGGNFLEVDHYVTVDTQAVRDKTPQPGKLKTVRRAMIDLR